MRNKVMNQGVNVARICYVAQYDVRWEEGYAAEHKM